MSESNYLLIAILLGSFAINPLHAQKRSTEKSSKPFIESGYIVPFASSSNGEITSFTSNWGVFVAWGKKWTLSQNMILITAFRPQYHTREIHQKVNIVHESGTLVWESSRKERLNEVRWSLPVGLEMSLTNNILLSFGASNALVPISEYHQTDDWTRYWWLTSDGGLLPTTQKSGTSHDIGDQWGYNLSTFCNISYQLSANRSKHAVIVFGEFQADVLKTRDYRLMDVRIGVRYCYKSKA